MKIMILGAGQVGSNLAEKLSKEKHDVTILEQNADRVNMLNRTNDIRAIHAAFSPLVLEEHGIADSDMLIAVTDTDEINLISCLVARKYGVEHTIARVNNVDYEDQSGKMKSYDFGAELIINQMSLTREEIIRLVQTPGAMDVALFSDKRIELVGFNVTAESFLAYRRLASLKELEVFQDHLVIAIYRKGKIIIPSGENQILPGDKIFIIGETNSLSEISPLIGQFPKKVHRVMIYGGNVLGVQLARNLQDRGFKVVLIEPDKEHAYKIKNQLRKGTIVHGLGSDVELLESEGIARTNVYIAISDNEEANLLACLTAKRHGAMRTMALIQTREFFSLIDAIELDVIISPKISTEGAILKYVRKGKVYQVASIKGTDTEALEIEAEANSPITRASLMELDLPKGVIIGVIIRDSEIIIPSGDAHIQQGDHVVVFHRALTSEDLATWFAERGDE